MLSTWWWPSSSLPVMMTSSNENIFRVTGPLWDELPVTGGFPSQRPVTRCFDVLFDVGRNKWLSKQSSHRWFETPSLSLWRHCNGNPLTGDPLAAVSQCNWTQQVGAFCLHDQDTQPFMQLKHHGQSKWAWIMRRVGSKVKLIPFSLINHLPFELNQRLNKVASSFNPTRVTIFLHVCVIILLA